LKALFETSFESDWAVKPIAERDEWDSRHEVIARKVLDLRKVRQDDLVDIALCQRSAGDTVIPSVTDLQVEEDSMDTGNPLSKAAFISRLYLVRQANTGEFSSCHCCLI
jgi:hypothetical protein